MNKTLSFLHLSDIHFTSASGKPLDLDKDIRAQLERDIEVNLKTQIKNFNGILVTGDIGYSGNQDEYKIAQEWLDKLCGIISCEKHQVWVVPGNHDVDRSKVTNSKPLQLIHSELRKTEKNRIDEEIYNTLKDDTYRSILFNPIENYIKFASKYGCEINPDRPFWESDGMRMNDGSLLHFRGLTSTIVSDMYDDESLCKLVLGRTQVQIPIDSSKIFIILCHHPTDWPHDEDNILPYLEARARVVLFGDKHIKWIYKKANTEGDEI